MTNSSSSPNSASYLALNTPSILSNIILHLHLYQPCCPYSINASTPISIYTTIFQSQNPFNPHGSDDDGLHEHIQDLVSCLTVCRSWFGPAKEQLWARFGELGDLLGVVFDKASKRLRFGDYVEEGDGVGADSDGDSGSGWEDSDGEGSYNENEPARIVPENLHRWFIYAPHIRKLKFTDVTVKNPSLHLYLLKVIEAFKTFPDTFPHPHPHPHTDTLFPNLHTIFAVGQFMTLPSSNTILQSILSPSTKCISLGYYNWSSSVRARDDRDIRFLSSSKEEGEECKDETASLMPSAGVLKMQLDSIVSRAPGLVELIIDPPTSPPPVEIKFTFGTSSKKSSGGNGNNRNNHNPLELSSSLLSSFGDLERISLPYLWTSPTVLRSLDNLPKLEDVYISRTRLHYAFSESSYLHCDRETYEGERERIKSLKEVEILLGRSVKGPGTKDGRFPSLLSLTTHAPSKDIDRFFLISPPPFPHLHTLHKLTLHYTKGIPSSRLSKYLYKSFPYLKEFILHLMDEGERTSLPFTPHSLALIGSFKDLIELEMSPLRLTIIDFEELLSSSTSTPGSSSSSWGNQLEILKLIPHGDEIDRFVLEEWTRNDVGDFPVRKVPGVGVGVLGLMARVLRGLKRVEVMLVSSDLDAVLNERVAGHGHGHEGGGGGGGENARFKTLKQLTLNTCFLNYEHYGFLSPSNIPRLIAYITSLLPLPESNTTSTNANANANTNTKRTTTTTTTTITIEDPFTHIDMMHYELGRKICQTSKYPLTIDHYKERYRGLNRKLGRLVREVVRGDGDEDGSDDEDEDYKGYLEELEFAREHGWEDEDEDEDEDPFAGNPNAYDCYGQYAEYNYF